MKIRKIILWALVLAWAGVIFYMSSQTSIESSDLSGSLIYELCRKFYGDFANMTESDKLNLVSSLQGIVRTMAHICEYGVLGILTFSALSPYKFPHKFAIGTAFGFFYAVSDEIHQYFVPGRAFEISDIMCDTFGFLLGEIFVGLIFIICRKIMAKKSKKHLQS